MMKTIVLKVNPEFNEVDLEILLKGLDLSYIYFKKAFTSIEVAELLERERMEDEIRKWGD
jgi:hypothetical protein